MNSIIRRLFSIHVSKIYKNMEQHEKSLYAILNLPRNATEQQVKHAYKQATLIYHPDKNPNYSSDSLFREIKLAHDILSDTDGKRVIYDKFGMEGLNNSWDQYQLSTFKRQDLINEFERQAKIDALANETIAHQSENFLELSIDAKGFFRPGLRPVKFSECVLLTALQNTQTYEISPKTFVRLTSKSTPLGFNITTSLCHNFTSKLYSELIFVLSRTPELLISLVIKLEKWVIAPTIHILNPQASVTLTRQIASKTHGSIHLNSGALLSFSSNPSHFVKISSKTRSEFGNHGISLSTGPYQSSLELDKQWSHKPRFIGEIKSKVGLAIIANKQYDSIQVKSSINKSVFKFFRFGLGVVADLESGISIVVMVKRYDTKFQFPIYILDELDLRYFALFSVCCGLAVGAAEVLCIAPYRKFKQIQESRVLRERNKETILVRKQEYSDSISILENVYKRKLDNEGASNGLIIISAKYGIFDDADLTIDVTIPVMALVLNSELHIANGFSKSDLIGFYDPLISSEYSYGKLKKRLHIEYLFRGIEHSVVFDDFENVDLPLILHRSDKK